VVRVLVCDDNRDSAELVGELLTFSQHEVYLCNDGRSCVERAQLWEPDVAVVDIRMPGMSGYEVAQAMRSLAFGHDILLIAYSAYGEPEDVRRAKNAGFDVHIVKSSPMEDLLQAIMQAPRAGRPS
jgi:CheY-like chemotaxis protein